MKKKILSVFCGIIIVIMLLAGVLIAQAVYDELTEKPLIRESLLDDKVELNIQGNDIQALLVEADALLQFREAGWYLGRAAVRQERNSEGTMEYIDVYLYFKQKNGTESIHRRIRLLKENGRWIVAEAFELDEEVHMDGRLSGSMLEEILGLAEEQMSLSCPESDEYRITVTSKEVSVTVFQDNDKKEKSITKRLAFLIQETEDGYQLEEAAVYTD